MNNKSSYQRWCWLAVRQTPEILCWHSESLLKIIKIRIKEKQSGIHTVKNRTISWTLAVSSERNWQHTRASVWKWPKTQGEQKTSSRKRQWVGEVWSLFPDDAQSESFRYTSGVTRKGGFWTGSSLLFPADQTQTEQKSAATDRFWLRPPWILTMS